MADEGVACGIGVRRPNRVCERVSATQPTADGRSQLDMHDSNRMALMQEGTHGWCSMALWTLKLNSSAGHVMWHTPIPLTQEGLLYFY